MAKTRPVDFKVTIPENSFLETTEKDTMKTTMNSKEGTRKMKHLTKKKSMINQKGLKTK